MTDAERRAADEAQLLALAAAEEAGTLPKKDRRHEELPADITNLPAPEVESVTAEAPDGSLITFVAEAPPKTIEQRVDVGGIIERTPQGWHVSLMYGGARKLHGDGATLENALLDAGV